MDILTAFLLGIIQGITEFLPVSSSGHLELAKTLFGDDSLPKESLLFTLVVHAATAMSTLFVFRKDISLILKDLATLKKSESAKFVGYIILSMLPAVVVGLLLEEWITQLFHHNVLGVGILLWVTAFLLFFSERKKETKKKITPLSALWIGVFQAIAILPGISRSGATLSSGLFVGIERAQLARFSFLMVIPLIFGSLAKSMLELDGQPLNANYLALGVGFVAAFVTGVVACRKMIEWVKKAKLWMFSIYCALVGSIAIITVLV